MPAFAATLRGLAPWVLYGSGLLLGGFLVTGGLLGITNAGEAILSLLGGVAIMGACCALGALAEAANAYLDQR
jgi:hypothetical protein